MPAINIAYKLWGLYEEASVSHNRLYYNAIVHIKLNRVHIENTQAVRTNKISFAQLAKNIFDPEF